MIKVFFDTEFTGLHQKTTLISIGLITETNKTFYAELNDYDTSQIDDWIRENVIKNLILTNFKEDDYSPYSDNVIVECSIMGLKQTLSHWLHQFDTCEMWSDCLSYDWVLFNQIWGHAFDIPENVYYIPFDICTLFNIKGVDPDISREKFCGLKNDSQKHNSLWDAKIIKMCYEKLIKM